MCEKFSRIPVYRENLDQMVGVVYVRTLLGHLGEGRGQEPIAGTAVWRLRTIGS